MTSPSNLEQDKISFLYQSILDTQATIRTADVKLGFLFVIYLTPIFKLHEIADFVNSLCSGSYSYFLILPASAWFLGFISLFMGLLPIMLPKINWEASSPTGRFFNDDLFERSFLAELWNAKLKTKLSPPYFLAGIPYGYHSRISILCILYSYKRETNRDRFH